MTKADVLAAKIVDQSSPCTEHHRNEVDADLVDAPSAQQQLADASTEDIHVFVTGCSDRRFQRSLGAVNEGVDASVGHNVWLAVRDNESRCAPLEAGSVRTQVGNGGVVSASPGNTEDRLHVSIGLALRSSAPISRIGLCLVLLCPQFHDTLYQFVRHSLVQRKLEIAFWATIGSERFVEPRIPMDWWKQSNVAFEGCEIDNDSMPAERRHSVADSFFRIWSGGVNDFADSLESGPSSLR